MSFIDKDGITIQGGAVRNAEVGYLISRLDEFEEDEVPHTIAYYFQPGERGSEPFQWFSKSCCVCKHPKAQMVAIGFDALQNRQGATLQN